MTSGTWRDKHHSLSRGAGARPQSKALKGAAQRRRRAGPVGRRKVLPAAKNMVWVVRALSVETGSFATFTTNSPHVRALGSAHESRIVSSAGADSIAGPLQRGMLQQGGRGAGEGELATSAFVCVRAQISAQMINRCWCYPLTSGCPLH